MSEVRTNTKAFAIYVLLGVALCGLAQLIFWQEMVFGYGVLKLPFLWAYAQQSVVAYATHSLNSYIQAAVWALVYCVAAVALWGVTGRGVNRPWLRALLAWASIEIGFVLVAVALVGAGVISLD